MKIGKETIPGLVQRNIASGLAYYWYSSPRQRKANWKSLALGQDLAAAIGAAKKRNAEIEAWEAGGARPRAVKAFTAAQTFAALLDRYETEKLVGLADNTQRTAQTDLDKLRTWAGKHPVAFITRSRVRALKLAICPDADRVPNLVRDGQRNIPGHNQAFKLLSKGREVFSWAIDHPDGRLALHNPFERFELAKPPPRDQIWEADAIAAFSAAASSLGWPSIDFALRLACNYGQREADLLSLDPTRWREISLQQLRMDREAYAALAGTHGPDKGKVMGLYTRQSKTRRWVGVPIAGTMRDEVEAAVAAARARASAAVAEGQPIQLVVARLIARDRTGKKWRGADMTGKPWSQRDFIEKVGEIRTHAANAARKAGNGDLADRIDDLVFHDTRRTCVVTLGELGMEDSAISARTGQKLETIKKILETYMPRTEAMAARGTIAMLGAETRRRDDAAKQQKDG